MRFIFSGVFQIVIFLGSFCQTPESYILINNGIIIDGTGGEVRYGEDILIKNDKIVSIGKNTKAPPGTKVIDATGKTVIPGLIDMHGHLYALGASQMEAYPKLYLAGGVTTIFSPGEFEPEKVLKLKRRIQIRDAIGPNIYFTGPYFDTENSKVGWIKGVGDTIELNQKFDNWKKKVDGIKVYSNISKEHFNVIARRAKQEGLLITGHLGTLSTEYAVRNGINGLEHGLFAIRDFGSNPNNYQSHMCAVGELDLEISKVSALINSIVENGVYVDPTIVIFEISLPEFKPFVENLNYFLDEQAQIIQKRMDEFRSEVYLDSCINKGFKNQLRYCKKIYDNGGILVTGTDPVSPHALPGFGIKREIQLLHQGARIPLEAAIQIASLNGARAIGIHDRTGSIGVGKEADLSIINGDITDDITLIQNTETVIKGGVVYNSKVLLEMVRGKVRAGNWKRDD